MLKGVIPPAFCLCIQSEQLHGWSEMQIVQSRNHLSTPQTQTTNIGRTNGNQCKTNFWKIAYFTE